MGDGLGTAGELGHDLVVEEGSRLAGPVRLTLVDATGGIDALFEVTGEPASVVDAYLDQLGGPSGETEVVEVDDAVVTTSVAGEAGGDSFSFTLVERDGHPTWLAVTAPHD